MCGSDCGEYTLPVPLEERYIANYNGESSDCTSPIWRVSEDRQHISFYGDMQSCVGATPWCKAHCYLKTKPAIALQGITPVYRIHEFKPPVTGGFAKDFNYAGYATFFASGSIEGSTDFDATFLEVIFGLPEWHPDKIFRFFTRGDLDPYRSRSLQNVKVIFSADTDTGLKILAESCEHKAIDLIAVVKHPDNESLTQFLRTRLPVIDCADCNGKYLCFNSGEKSLLLLDWIGGEEAGNG